jgi:hypothetical protein
MDVNDEDRLSNITITHILKYKNSACIVVLHFIVTIGFSTMRITHTLKSV